MRLFTVAVGMGAALALFGTRASYAETEAPGDAELASDLTKAARTPILNDDDKHVDAKLLPTLGLRFDTMVTSGGAVSQGFSVPSARLTAYGQVDEAVDYRFSIGQTREWSTIMLPQLLPVEGYTDVRLGSLLDWDADEGALDFRFGLFTPTVNPWWTPDLSDLPLPSYQEGHRRLLIARDLGAELRFSPIKSRLDFSLGIFNGSGIVALNTNNAKAVTGSAKLSVPLGTGTLSFGFGLYGLNQSSPGSSSYRSNFVYDFFVALMLPGDRLWFAGDGMAGTLVDSSGSLNPVGGAVTLIAKAAEGVKLFLRAESLQTLAAGDGTLKNFQAGPIWELNKNLQMFLLYQYLKAPGSSAENIGSLRLRINL